MLESRHKMAPKGLWLAVVLRWQCIRSICTVIVSPSSVDSSIVMNASLNRLLSWRKWITPRAMCVSSSSSVSPCFLAALWWAAFLLLTLLLGCHCLPSGPRALRCELRSPSHESKLIFLHFKSFSWVLWHSRREGRYLAWEIYHETEANSSFKVSSCAVRH